MSEHIRVSRDGAVLVVGIDRPEKRNALTIAMYESLITAFQSASADETIGAILLEGAGGVFTAGNDLGDFASAAASGKHPTSARRFTETIAEFDKPFVAAVGGLAVGVGATLCFHSDLVFASPNAHFSMPFVDLGLVPEAGSSLLAVRRFGMARAAQVILLAEPFDAVTAKDWGLVNAVVPAADLHAHALAKAQALAGKPRKALAASRRLMRGDPEELRKRMAEESAAFTAAVASDEARAAFMAFFSRTKS